MAGANQRIEVTLETLHDSVDLAEDITLRIADVIGFSEEERDRIGMSVRESVINACEYGNQRDRSKKIQVTFELEADRLIIRVLDQGKGFNLEDVPDPLAEENLLRASGRGILLIRAFMDEFTVRRGSNGGAEVVMVKRYPGTRPAESPSESARKEEESSREL